MGDTNPNHPTQPSDYERRSFDERSQSAAAGSAGQDAAAFQSQFGGISQQRGGEASRQAPGLAHYSISPQPAHGGPFNLGAMSNALPDYGTSQSGTRAQSSGSSGLRGLQYSPISPLGGQHSMGQYPGLPMDTQLDPTQLQQAQRLGHLGGGPSPFLSYGQPMAPYYYTNAQYNTQGQQPFYTGGAQNVAAYGRGRSAGAGQGIPPDYMGNFPGQGLGRSAVSSSGYGDAVASNDASLQAHPSSGGSMTSVPRGPPRKPKQSGHALWVGNLPPATTVLDLKDHFSRDATKDIESLFLISKSNCAFVNYRSEASCAAAMQRFHDSKFMNVRLVCRPRRGSASPAGIPSGPAAMSGSPHASASNPPSATANPAAASEMSSSGVQARSEAGEASASERPPQENQRDRFFIVKSLTLQDLNLSVRNGIWATQSHNEDALNKAYESAENVYLIFSANKSGEYFGYARMISAINEDAKEVLGSIMRHEPVVESTDALRTIPTPATETAPKGHIIDDSARGTIFWEAEHSDEEPEEEAKLAVDTEDDGVSGPQSWGKPFKIEWVSTNRLPFYRTRGLRNPWNANREVKIARDGTELEPSVGHRLIQMFHRVGPPAPQMQQMTGMPPPMGGPSMRHY